MKKLIDRWEKECPFREVLAEEKESINHSPKLFGYLRGDYDGCRWWNTWCPVNLELENAKGMAAELNRVYAEFVRAFPKLITVNRYCCQNLEPAECSTDVYYMFLSGEHANFWFRIITRRGDYNLYLYAFAKD